MKRVSVLVAAFSLTTVVALAAAPEKPAPGKSPAESGPAPASVFTPRTVKSTGTVTSKAARSPTTRWPARSSCTPRVGTTPRSPRAARMRSAPRTVRPSPRCSTSPTSSTVRRSAHPAHHLPLQRRSRLIDRVAAHGRLRPGAGRHAGTTRTRRPRPTVPSTTATASSMRATSSSSTRRAPASAASRARTRRRRSGASTRTCLRLRQLHHPVPLPVRPLELTEVPLRRELRHAPLRRARQRARDRSTASTSTASSCSRRSSTSTSASMGRRRIPAWTLPYEVALPTYAATAWYHHKLASQPFGPRQLSRRGRAVRHG